MSDSTPATGADQEVVIMRVFDAPREQVFRAWTDRDEVAVWYGPEHFDMPRDRIRIDARVGGRYELTMVRRDNGAEFPTGYEIVELVEPSSSSCARIRCRRWRCTSPRSRALSSRTAYREPARRGRVSAAFDKLAALVAE